MLFILLQFHQSVQNKIIRNAKKLACCQILVGRIRIQWTQSLLPARFPVSLNTFSAVAGLTWTLVFQSSISHSNCFLATGQREQHGHKSKVSWEPLLHEQAREMYCYRLWNAKKEKDVFTWWHCVYPSKADCRERPCRCTIWRRRMSEHSAEPGWHTNLTARSHWWWRATIVFGATSFSSPVSTFPHSSTNKTKFRGKAHLLASVLIPCIAYNHTSNIFTHFAMVMGEKNVFFILHSGNMENSMMWEYLTSFCQ